jgi:hypothetical protein
MTDVRDIPATPLGNLGTHRCKLIALSSVSLLRFLLFWPITFLQLTIELVVPVRHQRAEGRSGVINHQRHVFVLLLRIRMVGLG